MFNSGSVYSKPFVNFNIHFTIVPKILEFEVAWILYLVRRSIKLTYISPGLAFSKILNIVELINLIIVTEFESGSLLLSSSHSTSLHRRWSVNDNSLSLTILLVKSLMLHILCVTLRKYCKNCN